MGRPVRFTGCEAVSLGLTPSFSWGCTPSLSPHRGASGPSVFLVLWKWMVSCEVYVET